MVRGDKKKPIVLQGSIGFIDSQLCNTKQFKQPATEKNTHLAGSSLFLHFLSTS
jgi:hypothetical protein